MPSMPSLPLQRKSTFSLLKSSCAPKSRDFSTPAAFRINSAGFRQNYCKKAAPQEKSCGAIFRRKRNSRNRIQSRLKIGESRAADFFDGGFMVSSNMENPKDTCSNVPGILALYAFPWRKGFFPQGKTGKMPVFIKWKGGEFPSQYNPVRLHRTVLLPFKDQIT